MNARPTVAADESDAPGVGSEPAKVVTLGEQALSFRNFRLLPGARILLRDGQPVDIGSRAFDLLHILLRSQGAVVERDIIMRHVWPTTTVDDSNVRSQVSRVRKALGGHRDLLKTVPGRGYLLAADHAPRALGDEGAERPTRRTTCRASAEPSDAVETEVLRTLLRSVLDELREITREVAAERKLLHADERGSPPRCENETGRRRTSSRF